MNEPKKYRTVIQEHHNYAKSSKAIDQAGLIEIPNAIDVYGWSPMPAGTENAPVTQVHLHFGLPSLGQRVMIRFKGPDTLDALIDSLADMRAKVWGKP